MGESGRVWQYLIQRLKVFLACRFQSSRLPTAKKVCCNIARSKSFKFWLLHGHNIFFTLTSVVSSDRSFCSDDALSYIGLGTKSIEHANICLEMPKCAIFSTFWESHLKHTPKVGVHRENLLIGNVAQTVFGGFYICWDYVISFSQHFPMRKFSPSPPTSLSPLSHWNSENWLKFGKIFFLTFLKTKSQNSMGVVYFRKALGTSTSNMMIPGVNCVNFHNMPLVDQSLNQNF